MMIDDVQDTHSDSATAVVEPEIHEESSGSEGADAATPVAPVESTVQIARLVVKRSGAETDIEFPVNSPCTIGRFDPAVGPIDIDLASLPEGSYVSRKHAKLTFEENVWKVTDLNSSNGTFVLKDDFERVEECELENGTEIALGNARFVFKLS